MKQLSVEKQEEKSLVFVIHKHAATRMHYDFRLQIGSVMPSWAIPKGPTLEVGVRRLAMQTSDHAMNYRHFEGTIPKGEYGAGTVMIWDEGRYVPEIEVEKGKLESVRDYDEGQKVMKEGLKKGQLKFTLKGKKLKGSFALVKIRGFSSKPTWLLIKHKDKYVQKQYDANNFDFSVTTKRSLAEISKAETIWNKEEFEIESFE